MEFSFGKKKQKDGERERERERVSGSMIYLEESLEPKGVLVLVSATIHYLFQDLNFPPKSLALKGFGGL